MTDWNSWICPNCYWTNPGDDAYCGRCGFSPAAYRRAKEREFQERHNCASALGCLFLIWLGIEFIGWVISSVTQFFSR